MAGPPYDTPALEQIANHVLHDPAVAIVISLGRRIDTHYCIKTDIACCDAHSLGDFALVKPGNALDTKVLITLQPKAIGGFTLGELQRQDPHTDQVRAVNTLVRGRNHSAHPKQQGTLGGPVT